MQKRFDYIVDGTTFEAVAEESSRTWGKGVRIRIFDSEGNLRDGLTFACHPEFDDFEEFQNKTADERLTIAIDILNSGIYTASLEESRSMGTQTLLRFNGRDWAYPSRSYLTGEPFPLPRKNFSD